MSGTRRHASDPQFWKLTNDMNRHKSRCRWCPNLYATVGAYSNHIWKVNPEKELCTNQGPESRHVQPRSRKRRLSDLIDHEVDTALILHIISPESDPESASEGSDKEPRIFSDEESDGESPQSDLLNSTEDTRAGLPI